MTKTNCWEFMKCGRQPGGKKEDEFGPCPAVTDVLCDGINDGENAGRLCWSITGTLCGEEAQGSFAKKRGTCLSCDFYRLVREDQGLAAFYVTPPNKDEDKEEE